LWLADRAANFIVVVDTATDSIINELDLVGPLSEDPAPDLMALSPSGHRAYVTFRGPNPLTGNNPAVNNAKGNTPGLGVLRISEGGRSGSLQTLVPINHIVDDIQRADPHGIAVRRL
jgi:DNA-binding beta-propeller fold protein YncE